MAGGFSSAWLLWLILAVALGVAELMLPGVFLIFVAIAAGIVALTTLALPDLPLGGQLVALAAWTTIAVLIGRRWYRDYPVETRDPLLNDRARRMIGETVIVAQPIVNGSGRVRVGDSEWPASGPDAPEGTRMRVGRVEKGVVFVEPL